MSYLLTCYVPRKASRNSAAKLAIRMRSFAHESEATAALEAWRNSYPKTYRWRLQATIEKQDISFNVREATALISKRLGKRFADDVSDVVSEAWLLHRKYNYATAPASFYAVARFYGALKLERKHQHNLEQVASERVGRMLDASERVYRAIDFCDMPQRFRDLLSLLASGYTQAEIAIRLGVKQPAVSKLAAKLRKYLASEASEQASEQVASKFEASEQASFGALWISELTSAYPAENSWIVPWQAPNREAYDHAPIQARFASERASEAKQASEPASAVSFAELDTVREKLGESFYGAVEASTWLDSRYVQGELVQNYCATFASDKLVACNIEALGYTPEVIAEHIARIVARLQARLAMGDRC